MVRLRKFALLVILGAGCNGEQSSGEPQDEPEGLSDAQARALLVRASLDLRGVRPGLEEYTRLAEAPEQVDAMIEAYLHDVRFGDRIRDLFAPVLRTRIDEYAGISTFFPGEVDALNRSVGEEALQLIAYIAANDLPYTDMVLADYTMADEHLAAAWPIDYPADARGWRKARYNDGRPAAGLLATNSFWWRYPSNGQNFNRARANAISRIFLCSDIFARPVDFPAGIDLSSEEAVDNAVRTNTACLNCHAALDPLASFLYGFRAPDAAQDALDLSRYHPELERIWQDATGVPPGYFGTPGYTVRDLAQHIAGDPRFVDCAVSTVFAALLGRPVTTADSDDLTHHREAFLAGGLTLRPLIASILRDPRYQRILADEAGGASLKLMGPDLLAAQIEALTGFRLRDAEGSDLIRRDEAGLRSLAGGGDGLTGQGVANEPNATMLLVQQRLAEAASLFVVDVDAALPADKRRLFRLVDVDAIPTDMDLRAQISALHHALHGEAPDELGLTELTALWRALHPHEVTPRRTWAGLFSVLLRDPDLLLY